MSQPKNLKPRRVLIASSHPLFGQGLKSLLRERHGEDVQVVQIVSSVNEAVSAINLLNPDLVIVDYDDQVLNREEFLARFVEGERKLRVVLLSLQSGGEALVYDRRTLSASQIDNWFDEWKPEEGKKHRKARSRNDTPTDVTDRRKEMKHFIAVAVLVVVLTVLLTLGMSQVQLLPKAASVQAGPIDRLFKIEFNVIYFLFSLIIGFIVYSILVFRRKKGDLTDAKHIEGNTRLEIIWTAIPLVMVIALAFMGGQGLAETLAPDVKPLEIKVTGQQWTWRFEYPDFGIVSNELVMPIDRQALLKLTSVDVIHSFWVPEFRVKQDALPGGKEFVRDLRVTPSVLGDYKVRCSELCGTRHSYMEAPVRVVSSAEFDAWVSQQMGVSADPIERGKKVWTTYCKSCHSIDGAPGIGPSWSGIFGKEEELADGAKVLVDEAYLAESIGKPNLKIVKGFAPGLMPQNFSDQLTDMQLQDVIAFIHSLGNP
jgi:cytochrome c oxidase subunit II